MTSFGILVGGCTKLQEIFVKFKSTIIKSIEIECKLNTKISRTKSYNKR